MNSSTDIDLPAEISTSNGDPADLVEKWQSIDAKASAEKYCAIWTAAAKAANERNKVEAEGGAKGKGKGKAKDKGEAEAVMFGSAQPASDGKGGDSSDREEGGASNGRQKTPKDAELVKPEDVGATLMHKQWKNIKKNYRVSGR